MGGRGGERCRPTCEKESGRQMRGVRGFMAADERLWSVHLFLFICSPSKMMWKTNVHVHKQQGVHERDADEITTQESKTKTYVAKHGGVNEAKGFDEVQEVRGVTVR